MSPRSELGRPFLRFLTFSLFGGVSIFLSGCGAYSGPSEYERFKQKQDGFSGVIAAVGGTAKKEGKTMHGFQMTGWLIDLTDAEISDKLIGQIIEAGQSDAVFQLNFSNSDITDDQLAKLDAGKVLQKTVDLNLSHTAITDAGLDRLSNFYCLSVLNLKGTAATKEGAKRLGDKKIANPETPLPFRKQPELTI